MHVAYTRIHQCWCTYPSASEDGESGRRDDDADDEEDGEEEETAAQHAVTLVDTRRRVDTLVAALRATDTLHESGYTDRIWGVYVDSVYWNDPLTMIICFARFGNE